jgi:hypothetical protein
MRQGGNVQNVVSRVRALMNGNGAEAVGQMLMRSNPQFAQFVNANRGKSLEQVASENGLNYSDVSRYF